MAQPVAMVAPTDGQMSCDAAQFEMLSNQTKIQALYSEIDRAQDERTRNMFFGGLIGYATSEDGSAARAEIGALQARNTNVMMIMQRGGCWRGGAAATEAPAVAAPAPAIAR
ncbi:hypothetical protein EDC65_2226 [Stella humosa]|uniref:Uncharacterized protein n=1 Tax=Stella humosa TaxID=94 RepID=A0A3N1MCI9_9PROT|nr:hypothetical protein [Stella humosa]ROQ00427.1 hypothetical protein EDC65_2226 [Stella humosa]